MLEKHRLICKAQQGGKAVILILTSANLIDKLNGIGEAREVDCYDFIEFHAGEKKIALSTQFNFV